MRIFRTEIKKTPMKKSYRLLCWALACAALVFCVWYFCFRGWNGREAEVPSVEEVNLVFIGNSITYGATLADPAVQAPPVIVSDLLARDGRYSVEFRNCGHGGSTTVDWLPGQTFFTEASDAAGTLTEARPGGRLVFSIMLGTNDSAQSGPEGAPVSPEDYAGNLKSIVQTLLDRFPEAVFILNYPIWYSPTTHNSAVYLQDGLDRLKSYHPQIDSLVQEFAASAPSHVYAGNPAAYGFFEGNTSFFTTENGNSGIFYLHPNAEGAVKLAGFWADSIRACLCAGD